MEKENIDRYIEDFLLFTNTLKRSNPLKQLDIPLEVMVDIVNHIRLDQRLSGIEDSIETLKNRISEGLYEIGDKLTYHESE